MSIKREYWGSIIGLGIAALTWLITRDTAASVALFVIFGVAIPTAMRARGSGSSDGDTTTRRKPGTS